MEPPLHSVHRATRNSTWQLGSLRLWRSAIRRRSPFTDKRADALQASCANCMHAILRVHTAGNSDPGKGHPRQRPVLCGVTCSLPVAPIIQEYTYFFEVYLRPSGSLRDREGLLHLSENSKKRYVVPTVTDCRTEVEIKLGIVLCFPTTPDWAKLSRTPLSRLIKTGYWNFLLANLHGLWY